MEMGGINKHILVAKRIVVISAGLACVLALSIGSWVSAAESSFSQGFLAEDDLALGTVVATAADGISVEKATLSNTSNMVGVVTEDAVLELSDDSGAEVQVATGGRTLALVSDINGQITSGDKLTISPINGVGMSTDRSGYIFGTAQANFSAAQAVTTQSVKTKDGTNKTVRVGLLPVQVGVVQYDFNKDTAILPAYIVNFANAIARKEVSFIRIVIALAVLLIGTLSIALILVSAVRSSITSIGRNPLAAKAVHAGLFQVLVITFGILVAMLAIIYTVLVM